MDLEKRLNAKKKMMSLEKNMKVQQMEKKAQELKAIEKKNNEEAARLEDLQKRRNAEYKNLERQKEQIQKLQDAADNETDSTKKRRLTVQIRQFASRFQSAEKKVKRME